MDLLGTILAATRRIVELRRGREPFAAVLGRAARVSRAPGRFRAAISRRDKLNIIAECKRRSPLRGVLRREYDPATLARAYESVGAAAISVLTEPTFFDGDMAHLRAVAAEVGVPVLRKDFVIDEYQIAEARASGADAVLLIIAALNDDALTSLHRTARQLHLDVLVEVHDRVELDRALSAGAEIVGVNNRNLRTLAVETERSAALIGEIPQQVVSVAESGFRSPEELVRLRQLGCQAFLIGEWLMSSADPGATLRELLIAAA